MSHHDVLVVGTGLAGLTAAVRLAQSGARVRVLAKGVGATHLGGGTIDVLGYAPERVDRPGEALAALSPSHPYARVGVQRVAAALDWFKAQFRRAGYAYTGSLDENLLLPTAIGVPKPTALAPVTMAGGDLRDGDRGARRRVPRAQGLPPGTAGRRAAPDDAVGRGARDRVAPRRSKGARSSTRSGWRARSTSATSAAR